MYKFPLSKHVPLIPKCSVLEQVVKDKKLSYCKQTTHQWKCSES